MNDTPSKLNLKAVEEFKISQRNDMELGWHLLNIKSSNSQAARTARVLKIEVAQRLEDSFKLKEAFDDLMTNTLTDEENMVAFTAAPFLGDWKMMMKLGKKIEKDARWNGTAPYDVVAITDSRFHVGLRFV